MNNETPTNYPVDVRRVRHLMDGVWDMLWVHFDGEPELTTEDMGSLASIVESTVLSKLCSIFEVDPNKV